MFDISWTEFMLIGVVALIVIGPKELPGVLRTLGQWTRKVRSMAADFQNQFQEAMREAEMADLKKQVDDMAQDFKHFDPLKGVREDVETMGKDFERSLDGTPDKKAPTPAADVPAVADAKLEAPAAASEPAAPLAIEPPAPAELSQPGAKERDPEPGAASVGAEAAPGAAESAPAAGPDNAGRSE